MSHPWYVDDLSHLLTNKLMGLQLIFASTEESYLKLVEIDGEQVMLNILDIGGIVRLV